MLNPVLIPCVVKSYNYRRFPDRGAQPCRQRFKRYYDDLYRQDKSRRLDPSSYQRGGQYGYADLLFPLLDHYKKKGDLQTVDLIILCHWNTEHDPEGVLGAFVMKHYNIEISFFDIGEQGLLSPFTGWQLAIQWIKANPAARVLLMLCDQTTVPHADNMIPMPSMNSAAVFFLERGADSGLSVYQSDIVCNKQCLSLFSQRLNALSLVLSKRSPTVLVVSHYLSEAKKKAIDALPYTIAWRSVDVSACNVVELCAEMRCVNTNADIVCFLTQDIESTDYGLLWVLPIFSGVY